LIGLKLGLRLKDAPHFNAGVEWLGLIKEKNEKRICDSNSSGNIALCVDDRTPYVGGD
jgi:hypothetical protein